MEKPKPKPPDRHRDELRLRLQQRAEAQMELDELRDTKLYLEGVIATRSEMRLGAHRSELFLGNVLADIVYIEGDVLVIDEHLRFLGVDAVVV